MSDTKPFFSRFNIHKLLFEVSRKLDIAKDLRPAIQEVIDILGNNLKPIGLWLSLYNAGSDYLEPESWFGIPGGDKSLRQRPGSGLQGRVFLEGTPQYLSLQASGWEATLSQTLGDEDAKCCCVPVMMDRQTIGTLTAVTVGIQKGEIEDAKCFFAVIASLLSYTALMLHLNEESRRLKQELRAKNRPSNMIGRSGAMKAVYAQIEQVAQSDATVLLRGESGVGKELVAAAIHYSSKRSNRPFVKVNCAALPENLLESELFGHERGAFTGAVKRRLGRFEMAGGGTLFLDEIGDLSANLQAKLLRVLQEREFHRVGGDQTLKADVRIIAATNRDLESAMEAYEFREDLYYRLNVFPIGIPPLRARKEDINPLADHFVSKYSSKTGKHVRRITTPALTALLTYSWPGNVRELENCIERAILVCEGDAIQEADLPPSLQIGTAGDSAQPENLLHRLAAKEKEWITDALVAAGGNMAKAAKALGLTERKMGLRVKKYGIRPRQMRYKKRATR